MEDKHLIFPSMVSLLSNTKFSDLVLIVVHGKGGQIQRKMDEHS